MSGEKQDIERAATAGTEPAEEVPARGDAGTDAPEAAGTERAAGEEPAAGTDDAGVEGRAEAAARPDPSGEGDAEERADEPASGADGDALGTAPTRNLALTATALFADACERAAIAAQEMREHDLALESLTQVSAGTTAMLTAATRSGGTQELPASLRAASVAQAEAQAAEERRGREEAARTRRRHAAIAAAVAVVALIAVAVAAWRVVTDMNAAPGVAAVEQVLAADPDIMDGFASDDYVEATPYELTDVQVASCETAEDGSVALSATATVANESFESDVSATLVFARTPAKGRYAALEQSTDTDDGWSGAVVQQTATTRAIAGVTRDDDFAGSFDPTFDEAAQTCSYTAERTFDLWFGETAVSTPYTYAFDGHAWTRSQGEATSSTSYDADAIQGSYTASDGSLAALQSFTVSNFDAATGAFTIEYRAQAPGFGAAAVAGVIDCTLSRGAADGDARSYRQTDGCAYTFSGEGSSTGGSGTARIEGALGLDGTLAISLSADYTRPAFLFGDPTDETMELAGTLAHA